MSTLPHDLMRLVFYHSELSLLARLYQLRPTHTIVKESMHRFGIAAVIALYPQSKFFLHHIIDCEGFTPEIFEKCVYTNFRSLPIYKQAPPDIIDKYYYHSISLWKDLTLHYHWTLETLHRFQDRVVWRKIGFNPSFNAEMLLRYIDRVDWENISLNFCFTLELLEQFSDRIFWNQLSCNDHLTLDILQRYADKLYWPAICEYYQDPQSLIEHFPDRIVWPALSESSYLTLSLVQSHQPQFDITDILNTTCNADIILHYPYDIDYDWPFLSENIQPTLAFIQLFEDEIVRERLSANPHLTPDIIHVYKDRLDWEILSANRCLTFDIVNEHATYIEFDILTSNAGLFDGNYTHAEIATFVETYSERWDWPTLSYILLKRAWTLVLDYPHWPWKW